MVSLNKAVANFVHQDRCFCRLLTVKWDVSSRLLSRDGSTVPTNESKKLFTVIGSPATS